MTYPKVIKPYAANDNRHDQYHWNFLHTWLDFWLDRQRIPLDKWNYNRAIHYTYELFNRPWLPERFRTQQLTHWLEEEALANGFSARPLTNTDLPP
jgi:hypothetical protein